jgi:DNA-binding NtrC family response regulator
MDVLIVDDEKPLCEALAALLEKEGFSCAFETDARRAVERAHEARVVLLDLKMPGVDGFELLDAAVKTLRRTPVVMLTAHGTVKTAVEAMKRGAFDFITKPPDRAELSAALKKALGHAEAERGTSEMYYDMPKDVVFRDGKSRALIDALRRAAASDLPILLEGETGVGKEVFAKLAHEWSPRAKGPFVKINCGGVPETLFESEFFGYEKGAFTGANTSKPGRVELAAGGTLFLDEIGELPAGAQAKLLQFLQDRTFERVGGLRTLKADVRVVAATNRDLEADAKKGAYRKDLVFRIAGVRLRVPPLRERPQDVEALAGHFLEAFAARYGKDVRFEAGAVEALAAQAWPGNVRELEHAIEKAVAMSTGAVIAAAELVPDAAPPDDDTSLRAGRKASDRERIAKALEETNGNRTQAAKLLGITRRALQMKLKELGIRG